MKKITAIMIMMNNTAGLSLLPEEADGADGLWYDNGGGDEDDSRGWKLYPENPSLCLRSTKRPQDIFT